MNIFYYDNINNVQIDSEIEFETFSNICKDILLISHIHILAKVLPKYLKGQ